MKILQVNCVYKSGSTGKIVYDVHTELQRRGVESVVCYGRGAKTAEPGVYKTCGELYSKANNLLTRLTGVMYGGCHISTARLISVIRKEAPDVVHLHCINGYFVNIYRLIGWLKKRRVKTVLTLHAEFMYTANCGHAMDCEKWKSGCGRCPRLRTETKSWLLDGTARSWKKMRRAFAGFERDCIVTSVSPWLMERAQSSPILSSFRHETVLNGIDTSVFRPDAPAEREDFRREAGLAGGPLILHVTAAFSMAQDHIKGGRYVAEMARRMPECTFAVIGNREEVPGLPENVVLLGRLEDQGKLARWYSAADVTLLTSQKETFSMVTAESLACGTPVVGFFAGAPERIAMPRYSTFVEYGDARALESALREMLARGERVPFSEAQAAYSKEEMTKNYCKVYERVVF